MFKNVFTQPGPFSADRAEQPTGQLGCNAWSAPHALTGQMGGGKLFLDGFVDKADLRVRIWLPSAAIASVGAPKMAETLP